MAETRAGWPGHPGQVIDSGICTFKQPIKKLLGKGLHDARMADNPMHKPPKQSREGLFKGIVTAYAILLLHLLLIAALGLVVIFLTGIAHYMFWIVLAGMSLVAFSAYLFFRRLRKEGRTLGETLRTPAFGGREVEVSLLGGLATMRLGKPRDRNALEGGDQAQVPQIEDPEALRIKEIQSLAQLLEKNLITLEEYTKAKNRLFDS